MGHESDMMLALLASKMGASGGSGGQGEKGEKGDKGDPGEPFSISKVYDSISAMNAGYASDGVPVGGFVVIDTGNVEDEDNAKLYYKGISQYEYLTDMSGATGLQGPKGDKGDTGALGATGAKGADGYTPVKGTDYWTEDDKQEIIAEVLAALGNPAVFGTVDENNIITIAGDLADGTYTLQYENEDGTTTKIGIITIGEVAIVNVIPISTDADGNIYNDKGYKTGTRISSNGVEKTDVAECELTGFIPFVKGDLLRGSAYSFASIANDGSTAFKNMAAYNSVACFNASKTWLTSVSLDMRTATADGLTVNSDSSFVFESILNANIPADTAYIRVSMINITDDTIFTVNQ